VTEPTGVSARVEELRRAFDRAFAEAPDARNEPTEDLLAIRVAGKAYAVRMAEISGLAVDRRIVPVPGSLPELVGLVGVSGRIRPVYDLGALLGAPAEEPGRWLLFLGRADPVALAFSQLDGRLRAAQRDVAPPQAEGTEAWSKHVLEVVRIGSAPCPILNLASIREAIEQRVRALGPRQER